MNHEYPSKEIEKIFNGTEPNYETKTRMRKLFYMNCFHSDDLKDEFSLKKNKDGENYKAALRKQAFIKLVEQSIQEIIKAEWDILKKAYCDKIEELNKSSIVIPKKKLGKYDAIRRNKSLMCKAMEDFREKNKTDIGIINVFGNSIIDIYKQVNNVKIWEMNNIK